ncbi:sugar phosphate nucleotidyltransferase [Candidatus Nanopusillus massiliensis]|uniref:sugar phosphate nucleotidyltransferase n=1 Tax=Candidatus Nanopusillus massiliensis TaxID=2897163 RepID=UPI002112A900|nr:sugar phosphate nucleotidyltransferase [Candidatus Nanopusillus massiliensis]
MSINNNLLIFLGDNLFSFNLNKIIKLGNENNSIALAVYDIKNYNDAKNYGVVKMENNIIKEFYEKPQNPLYTTIFHWNILYSKGKIAFIRRIYEF